MSEPLRIKLTLHQATSPQLFEHLAGIDNPRLRVAVLLKLAEERLQFGIATQRATALGPSVADSPRLDSARPALGEIAPDNVVIHPASNDVQTERAAPVPALSISGQSAEAPVEAAMLEAIESGLGKYFT
jgi:hypothetical protein